MLGSSNVFPTIAVKDYQKAKQFYTEVLGLEIIKDEHGGGTFKTGDTTLYIYPSETAGSNQATCAAWRVDDLDEVAADLKSKGVSFEHYDIDGMTLEGDVHMMGDFKVIWFKDPDGNIFAADNGQSS